MEEVYEKHLSGGEVLLMEGRAIGADRFKIATSADNTVERIPRVNAGMAAARVRGILPELLESPLDEGVERLGVQLEQSKINELAKHPTERWLSPGYSLAISARSP